jgi:mannose/fructose/N-acetylgalactosamine-specific phosphotransferase system component IIC
MELADIFIIALVGALLTLDTTTILQSFISQPLIACTLIGGLSNDFALGLQIGMIMQFLWISSIPVGAAIIPGGNGAAMISTALAIYLSRQFPELFNIILLLIVLYAILLSFIGAKLRVIHHNKNIFILDYIMKNIDNGGFNVLRKAIIFSVILNYVRFFVLIYLGLIIGDYIISKVLLIVPAIWDLYAKYTVTALWAMGLGLALTFYDNKDMRKYILIGVGVGVIIMAFLR